MKDDELTVDRRNVLKGVALLGGLLALPALNASAAGNPVTDTTGGSAEVTVFGMFSDH